jgi:HAD superfamily hydrolase (TIGR01509 family)
MLRRCGLLELLDVVVSAADLGEPKPSPYAYLEACRRLRVRPCDSLAVEDSRLGYIAADRAGLRCLLVSFASLVDTVTSEFSIKID